MADIKRLNYFNGQFLKQEDFNDEQAYHIDMRRRLNRSLQTWGVADTGLQVTVVPGANNQISVGAGMALDNQGREIVLLTPQTKNLAGEPANSDVYVTIQYQETKTDPPPNSPDVFTRWTEEPKVEVVRTEPAADGAVVTLARIHLDASSNVASIDQSIRTIASSKIGPVTSLQVGNLNVTGIVGIGTISPNSALHVKAPASSNPIGALTIDVASFNTPSNSMASYFLRVRDIGAAPPDGMTHFYIRGDGNVGIGTSNPGRPLTIRGRGTSEELLGFENPAGAATWHITQNLGGNKPGLNFAESGVEDGRLFIKAGGNIGVGTTEPKAKLDVRGHLVMDPGADPDLYTGTGASELSRYLRLLNSPDRKSASGLKAGGILVADDYGFANPGKNDLIVKGNVGIGTAEPKATLDVRGSIMLSTADHEIKLTREQMGFAEIAGANILKLALTTTRQKIGDPDPSYGLWIGHPSQMRILAGGVLNSFTPQLSVSSDGSVFVRGILTAEEFRLKTGAKGGFVTDYFLNSAGDAIEQGDVVIIGKHTISQYWATQNMIPIPEIDLTDKPYDQRVCGIVFRVVTEKGLPYVEGEQERGLQQQSMAETSEVRTSKKKKKTTEESFEHPLAKLVPKTAEGLDHAQVQAEQLGEMVTLGSFSYCKVDADIAPIQIGDLLTTSTTKGHAQKVLDKSQAVGAIVGKALGSLKKGKGKIPVLVMLQ